jgi:hypothetical protein
MMAEPVDACRPVTVEVDGKQVTMRVRSEQPMSDESRAYFAEIVAAARRKFDAEAGKRCGHTKRGLHGDQDGVCTKRPGHESLWHADGSGKRWRKDFVNGAEA